MITPDRELRVEIAIETRLRPDRQFHRLPGPARQRPRSLQGGAALSSARRPGRGAVAGQPDDLEDGGRRPPVRRRQGGYQLRPAPSSRAGELERLTRKFVQKIHDFIGPDKDIPAPDMGTDAQVMAWIMNEYAKFHGFQPACVTGKPVEFHGSAGREAATGYGVALVTREMLGRLGRVDRRARPFAIQGYGNVGSYTARFLSPGGGEDRRRVRRVRRPDPTRRDRHRRARPPRGRQPQGRRASREASRARTSSF